MSNQFDRKNIIPRFRIIIFVMIALGVAVVGKALYIATVERDYWLKAASKLRKDSVAIKPTRGNILSCDGQLMASSLPEFRLFMDFKAGGERKDSIWRLKLDSICDGLHAIFPEKSAADFRRDLEEGRRRQSQNWPVWSRKVSYNVYAEVKKLPVFRMNKYIGGFHVDTINARQRPFGSLAKRTVGDIFGRKDSARCGLEQSYDSLLRGQAGLQSRQKVLSKYVGLVTREPVDGADIVTTIDVNMQDLAERALIQELKKPDGICEHGVAIVMEVKTGDVKAIVNMSRGEDGEYYEFKNLAVSNLLEPGSVFKTASIMVALDDGVVDTTYHVDTGCGIWDMYGAKMRDHNWHKGGYQVLSLPQTLEYSSNIGISRIIDKYYSSCPEKFVEGIDRLGLRTDLHLPFQGAAAPRIRMPKKNSRGQYVNWSKTALPWMSIGYETQIPPISTLTFYNAIANGGTMVRPRFVKSVVKDGQTIREYPTEVIKPRICKPKTLGEIQTILEHVVSQGLGRKAGSRLFKVAGKTGTAQISKGRGGYKAGGVSYLLSFVGYFPADAPRYSCIVCIQKTGGIASGGGTSGVVFHNISEGIMAQDVRLEASDARDSLFMPIPTVKNGNLLAADYVLGRLGISTNRWWGGSYADGNPIWGRSSRNGKGVAMSKLPYYNDRLMPDVTGMGARDAVYMLESRGLKVRLEGRGKVVQQSIAPGKPVKKGQRCTLKMEV